MRDEHGSGTGLLLGALAVLVGLMSVALIVGAYGVADHRATAAADHAALAGAQAAASGQDGCSAARKSAETNGARVVSCDKTGDAIEHVIAVKVEVDLPHQWPGLPGKVTAEAWAGRVQ